jgi:hypothetical protein
MVDDILIFIHDGSGVLYVFFLDPGSSFMLQMTYVIHGYHYCLLGSITCDIYSKYMLVTTNKGKIKERLRNGNKNARGRNYSILTCYIIYIKRIMVNPS